MKTNKTLLSLAIVSSLTTISSGALGAGFQLAEYSATGLGRAYAGEAAMADNAGSQWRNPALLTYLEGTQVSAGAIYVDPNVDLDGTVTDGYGNSQDVSVSDYADDAVIPNFYLSHKYNDTIAVGFALSTNYGMNTDLGSDYEAAHLGDSAEVETIEANINLGYQLTDTVSLGAGVRYVTAEGHFGASAADSSAAATYYDVDDLKYMEGDTTAWAWQAGLVWQVSENNRIGVAYKSEVDLDLEGTATGYGFFGDTTTTSSGSLPLTLPATAELASFHQLTERFAMHASINWTDWSSFNELRANIDGMDYDTRLVKTENWEDNYRFALGGTYQLNPKWLIRSGIAYDTSAVGDDYRSATIRKPTVPG